MLDAAPFVGLIRDRRQPPKVLAAYALIGIRRLCSRPLAPTRLDALVTAFDASYIAGQRLVDVFARIHSRQHFAAPQLCRAPAGPPYANVGVCRSFSAIV